MKHYFGHLGKVGRLALAASVKAMSVAFIVMLLFYFLGRNLPMFIRSGAEEILEGLYLLFMLALCFWLLKAIMLVFAKMGRQGGLWMMLFIIVDIFIIGLIAIVISSLTVDWHEVLNFIKGPFNVTIYLG